jgi:hypothetical protein
MMGLLEEIGWSANSASDVAKVASAEEVSRKGAKEDAKPQSFKILLCGLASSFAPLREILSSG